MKNQLIIGVLIALLAGGALGFFGGMQYQKSQQSQREQFTDRFQEAGGQRGQFGPRRGDRPDGFTAVNGKIIAVDEESVTVELEDGSSKIILISEDTNVNKSTEGEIADLVAGEQISAFGTENSDGSVSADNVRLGENQFRNFRGQDHQTEDQE